MTHFEEASRIIAGGVNSPVRAFRGDGGEPLFIRRARGAYIETEDGRQGCYCIHKNFLINDLPPDSENRVYRRTLLQSLFQGINQPVPFFSDFILDIKNPLAQTALLCFKFPDLTLKVVLFLDGGCLPGPDGSGI